MEDDIDKLIDELGALSEIEFEASQLKEATDKAKTLLSGKRVSLGDGVYYTLHRERGVYTLQIQQIIKGLDKATLRTIHTEKFKSADIETLALFIKNAEEELYGNYIRLMYELESKEA